jgi:signal transduction histidine kinase
MVDPFSFAAYVANIGHDLRAPLNSVLGFAQVISEGLDGPLTSDMASDVQRIEKNGAHLLNLVNDVIDMAKIESGRIKLNLESININGLLQETIKSLESQAEQRALFLGLESESEGDFEFVADRTRLRQIFALLITSAIKRTEKGGIIIQLSHNTQTVSVKLRDTGAKIPPEKIETIFTEGDINIARRAMGSGLEIC